MLLLQGEQHHTHDQYFIIFLLSVKSTYVFSLLTKANADLIPVKF